jgi:hypothetical protein
MPNVSQHLAKVRSNKDMLSYLGDAKSTKFPDWFATVSFYIAVHSVEAILCQEVGLHTRTHIEREEKLRNRLPAIDQNFLRAYRTLYARSCQARYMIDKKFQMLNKDCEAALADLEVIETECKETYFENYSYS